MSRYDFGPEVKTFYEIDCLGCGFGSAVLDIGAIFDAATRDHADDCPYPRRVAVARRRETPPGEPWDWEVIVGDPFKRMTTSQHGPQGAVEQALHTALSLEADLEKALVSNLDILEPGLQLWKNDGKSGEQYAVGEAGRIDLLCIDRAGNLVVVELKAGDADHKVCGQIQAYMGWIKENLARNRKVRGIIVASEFSDKLTYAVKVSPDISLMRYQVNFTLSAV